MLLFLSLLGDEPAARERAAALGQGDTQRPRAAVPAAWAVAEGAGNPQGVCRARARGGEGRAAGREGEAETQPRAHF